MKVRFFAHIRDYTGTKEIYCGHCQTLKDLLEKLSEQYGKNFQAKVFQGENLSSEVVIMVNGRHVAHLAGLATKLNENDDISIFPVLGGG
ncbi:ThiS family protein [Pelotomaculum sp. FP]|uniref:ubiquitin-like small modifier protein 1 n=1 Tax=Pelotomaculum sp. FP TaxID=261474 RepID=UPI0010657A78|nr:ubiquitin-like small modifier protein 1 [Pelotomaculum sp. FP]TEB16403.1 ThiS family protein [Pelotomaculum sp. FP]